ncbi:MAG: CAP domain-containing protein [Aureispira sp.]|nr:CAP domain-containing protein [Aureispira sp.]
MNKLLKYTLGLVLLSSLSSCITDEPLINPTLGLVNDVRQQGCTCAGEVMPPVDPITWNDSLEKAAENHSLDMSTNNFLTHSSTDGANPGDRIRATGYKWDSYAENIAEGQATQDEVMDYWLYNEKDCKNIMKANVTEMGAAKTGEHWVQVFAKPK